MGDLTGPLLFGLVAALWCGCSTFLGFEEGVPYPPDAGARDSSPGDTAYQKGRHR
jgi:hypothetical protein